MSRIFRVRWRARLTLPLVLFLTILAFRLMKSAQTRVRVEWRWYDLWRGLYIRPPKPGETTIHLYWCPIWCLAIHIECPWPLKKGSSQLGIEAVRTRQEGQE